MLYYYSIKMAMYSVVHFFGDDSVEPVPSIWISKNGTCAWPKNGALIKKYIQLKTIPNEIEFVYHKARVLKTNISKKILFNYKYFFAIQDITI